MRAARYSRVSTTGQVHNTSIPNQLERTAAYIEAQGWTLVATFTEPGESGENLERPALRAARQAARRGEFDVLVVYTLDRLTRNIDDLFLLRREFAALGVKVWAVHDGLDVTTAALDDLLGVLFKGYFGHRELTTIRRRMVEGIERHVREGKFAGGLPPYGYRCDEQDNLVIYEPEAETVRMIVGWVVDRLSTRKVAQRLNDLRVPCPHQKVKARRRKDGTQDTPGGWTPATITFITHNETYAGVWTYDKRGQMLPKVMVNVPPIVERDIWEGAQEAVQANRRNTRPAKHRYLLRGKIRCECGMTFCSVTPRHPGGKWWYRCGARYCYRDVHRREPCKSLTIDGEELEAAMWADIEQFIKQPHLVAAELSTHRGPAGEGITARLAEVDRAIAERRAELDRCLGLYLRNTIPVEHLDAKAREVQGHLNNLQKYRAGLVEEQQRADLWEREMIGVVEALTALQEQLDSGITFEDKPAVVDALVKDILIETQTDDDGKRYPVAHITYRFGRPNTAEASIPIELEPLFAGFTGTNCQALQIVLY